MRKIYIQPQTEWVRMTECETILAVSGGIGNSGQDDDGGSAKQGFTGDGFWEEDNYDLWSDQGDE